MRSRSLSFKEFSNSQRWLCIKQLVADDATLVQHCFHAWSLFDLTPYLFITGAVLVVLDIHCRFLFTALTIRPCLLHPLIFLDCIVICTCVNQYCWGGWAYTQQPHITANRDIYEEVQLTTICAHIVCIQCHHSAYRLFSVCSSTYHIPEHKVRIQFCQPILMDKYCNIF